MKDIFSNKAPSNKNLCRPLTAGCYYGRAQDLQTFQKSGQLISAELAGAETRSPDEPLPPSSPGELAGELKRGWTVVSDKWVPGFICKLNKVSWDFAYDLSNAGQLRGKLDHHGSKIGSLWKRVAVLGTVAAWWGFTGKLSHQANLVPAKASDTDAQKDGPDTSAWTNLARRSWEMLRDSIIAKARLLSSP